MKQLKQYNTGKRLQQATIEYIVRSLATQEDVNELEKAFKAINTSQTGKITREELEKGFGVDNEASRQEVQAIFDEVDLDGNGEIEFSEWIVASIDKRSLVTDEKLVLAF